ncbi:TniQ family protein [Celeribacter halophilus]|uniref:TniQ protein n=1 Tax=Celeribacter halophilus TaxID=576117 RepID=A0A1I3RT00_9RHOB|nr:TniQ family protein [Celeribacter halophilus]PZX06773.1 TniQ protein [Celeribacter halophilus]SFJ49734.1 TniQ protein [Celeribacter halophilus]
MTLWPTLPFDSEETLLSYADRLAMMHTGWGMGRLLKDFGINVEHFTSGREEAVAAFAEGVGLPFEDIQRTSVRTLPWGGSFRSEPISKGFLSPQVACYCPACLEEDGQRSRHKFRLLWGFHHVVRCDRHNVWLTQTPQTKANNMRVALGDAPMGERVAATAETPAYLSWLRERVHGHGSPNDKWLAEQTIEQVLTASEMLGCVLEHGHKVTPKKLSLPQTEEATDIGFSIYGEGPEAITEALDTIRGTSPAKAVQAGPLAYYGKLFDWLDRRCNKIDPGPIRDLLRDHIVKHSAVEPGTMVLGVEITERRYHTLSSLSEAVGVKRPRLSRLLKKMGELPADASEVESGGMVFEAARTVSLIEDYKTAILLKDVPEYLGASKRQVENLYRRGILQPLIPRTARGAVRHVVFGRKHLDEILKRISELPDLDETEAGNFHPISYACQRGAGCFEDILVDIFEGRVSGFRNRDQFGIGSIYVDVSSLVATKKSA